MNASVVFRLEPLAVAGADATLCRLPWARLVRGDAGTFLECPVELMAAAPILLARSGLRARAVDALPAMPPALEAGLAKDLVPLAVSGAVDRISLRPVRAADALARFMRRRPFLPDRRDVRQIRAILRDDERIFAWRRVIWASRSVLRSGVLHGVRPVFFDRGAVERSEERWSSATRGELTRWVRA